MRSEFDEYLNVIDKWHALAQAGTVIPMRVRINGTSMYPLIRKNKDYVTIYPRKGAVKRGGIVMFPDAARTCYILHRVWKINGTRILTWGDNCTNSDDWIPEDDVWGIAVSVERNDVTIQLDTRKSRCFGMFLACIRHLYCRTRKYMYALAGRMPPSVRQAIKRVVIRKKRGNGDNA